MPVPTSGLNELIHVQLLEEQCLVPGRGSDASVMIITLREAICCCLKRPTSESSALGRRAQHQQPICVFLQLPDGFDQWEDPEGGQRSKYWLFQLPLCFTIALTVVISLCLQAQLFHSHRSHKGETLCSTEGGKLLFLLLPLYFSEMFHHPLSVPLPFHLYQHY